MKTPRFLLSFLLLCFPLATAAQTVSPNAAFGINFFDDLRRIFGELQRSELDRVFQRAKVPQCSELAVTGTEWKHVAYLNDDRTLAAWHFDSIAEVKKDPTKYIFAGNCRTEDSALIVSTSFPVHHAQENVVVIMRNNAPVNGFFDRRSQSLVFELPYLYQLRKNGLDVVYSLLPPEMSSRPEPGIAEEMRCKALSDSELTYRFLLCRARLLDRSLRSPKLSIAQPLGGAAYYILSDGNEAGSTVKLTFEDDVQTAAATGIVWQPPAPGMALPELASKELRIRFDPTLWTASSMASQMVRNGMTSNLATSLKSGGEYCNWYPVARIPTANAEIFSTLALQMSGPSVVSAGFEMESGGRRVGTLLCYFSPAESPAVITVDRWQTIVGALIRLEFASER